MKKVLIVILLYRVTACLAQDPFFSQYNSNAIYLNPAFAGSFEKAVFTAAYRDQWPGWDKTYRTFNFSFNKYYSKIKGGIGVYYLYDQAGDGTINTHNIQLMFAPHFQLKNFLVIKPCISLGYVNKSLNWAKLTFGNMIDPRYGFTYPTFTNPPRQHVSNFDISSGILVYNNFFSAGAVFNHINEPDESFIESGSSPLPIRYTFHGSLTFLIPAKETAIGMQPSVVYAKQGNSDFYKVGFTLKYSWLLAGVYYQANYENLSLMIGFGKKDIRIGYSYDHGNLNEGVAQSHEIFISYSLPNKKQKTEGMVFNNSFAF